MFLAFLENNPVCLIDLELETGAQASFALAVAPGYRRRGIAAATIKTLLHHGVLAETTELYGGVAQGNLASEALVRKTGFRPRGERDADGFQDFCLRTK